MRPLSALTACAAAAPAPLPGNWQTETSGTAFRIRFKADGTFQAQGRCNLIIGRWQADGGKLSLSRLGATEKACAPR